MTDRGARRALSASLATLACLLAAGCSRHGADAAPPVPPATSLPPLHAKAGPAVDGFWSVAAPVMVRRYDDVSPEPALNNSRDISSHPIAIAPDGGIDAGKFRARMADATSWTLQRSGIEGGGMSTIYSLGGDGWQFGVHLSDDSDLAEAMFDREAATPRIVYATATVPRATRPAARPAYEVAGRLVAPGVQTLPGAGRTEVDLAAGRIVIGGRTFSLAGIREETVQYADGRLTYLGTTPQVEGFTIEYRDGRLARVDGP